MTILKIIDRKKSREIDLTPVENIKNNLEKILSKRENVLDRSHIKYSAEILEETKRLNKEQLKYLANEFVGLINRYADLYQSALDNPEEFCERINEYKRLMNIINKNKDLISKI